MRISLAWLSDYVSLPPPDELARKLTMAGLEVEGVQPLVVVGQILESKPHPNAEKLSVTKVDVGRGKPLQIVCGAKNYKVGDKVPVALVGAELPGDLVIKEANLRGVESFGMLCSARELGLSEDSSGLLILDAAKPLGLSMPMSGALPLEHISFEVNVTPNRADALSHLGIARDVATLTNGALKSPKPSIKEGGASASSKASVRIDWPERCPRYMARVIEGVKIGPSPQLVQSRLRSAGVRSINNVVDVTNYVLLELGHPLHAFDLDLVQGNQIIVRAAKAGEKLTTLDGKERDLTPDDLVIADAKRAVALAGVMGGNNSEVSDKTTRILLESAYFQPGGVRRTARRFGLHSEASHRFERGTDIDGLSLALDRAAAMIAELAGGTVLRDAIDVYPQKVQPRQVTLRHARLDAVLGVSVPADESVRILSSLGFEVLDKSREAVKVSVPLRRVDVEREEDLIEEVARIRGYESIPASLPRVAATVPAESREHAVEKRLRASTSAAGLSEVLNYSFVSEKELRAIDPKSALGSPIALKNPLSVEMGVMRTSLLPGLLQNLSRSVRHQVSDVKLYELGRVYRPGKGSGQNQPAVEELRLAGVLSGRRTRHAWSAGNDVVDFYDAKGVVEGVLQSLEVHAHYEPAKDVSWLHPRSAAYVVLGEGEKRVRVGTVGELHPLVVERLELPAANKVYAFDLDVAALAAHAELVPSYHGLPIYPAVLRDMALVLDDAIPAEQVESAIRQAGGQLVEDVLLFDVYKGQPVPSGRKSLAFAIRYRAADRTLTDAEALQMHERIVAAVAKQFGAELRS